MSALGLSVPSLSRGISLLEQELGVQVFVRTTRAVALTQPGMEYAQRARYLLEELKKRDRPSRQFAQFGNDKFALLDHGVGVSLLQLRLVMEKRSGQSGAARGDEWTLRPLETRPRSSAKIRRLD